MLRLGEVITLYLLKRGLMDWPVCPRDRVPPPEQCRPITGCAETDYQTRERIEHEATRRRARQFRLIVAAGLLFGLVGCCGVKPLAVADDPPPLQEPQPRTEWRPRAIPLPETPYNADRPTIHDLEPF